MNRLVIASTGSYAPQRRVSNDELSETLDTSDEWIVTRTGIKYRHILADDQCNSDMATEAARRALDAAGLAPEQLGTIMVATCSGDFGGNLPATACVVQNKLGAVNAAAFDIVAACSGFVYGLEVAQGLAVRDDRPMLLIGSEALSRIVDWTDRNTAVLFGDGAGAAVLTLDNESPGKRGIVDSLLCCDGTGIMALHREGGTRYPIEEPPKNHFLYVDGKPVFNFAVKAMVRIVSHFLEKHNLSADDVKYVIPHQANYRIIRAAMQRLPLPEEKFYLNVEEFANTSAASIIIAMDELNRAGKLQRGDAIITCAFGAGLTFGGNLLYW